MSSAAPASTVSSSTSTSSVVHRGLTYLCQRDAIAVDEALFESFSVDALMELAGYAVAQAIAQEFPDQKTKILILAGPGNNGGDGLVAARHLWHFGYREICVYCPKVPLEKPLFRNLLQQIADLGIDRVLDVEELFGSGGAVDAEEQPSVVSLPAWPTYEVYVDAIFGFSFRGWRGGGKDSPYDRLVEGLKTVDAAADGSVYELLQPKGSESDPTKGAGSAGARAGLQASASDPLRTPGSRGNKWVVSVDIPSGWLIDDVRASDGVMKIRAGQTAGATGRKYSLDDTYYDLNDPGTSTQTGPGAGAAAVDQPRGLMFVPHMLVSLTLPKLCSKGFLGVHYVGGRFVPPTLSHSMGLVLPGYGAGNLSQVVRVDGASDGGGRRIVAEATL